jgi:hypothetical protein
MAEAEGGARKTLWAVFRRFRILEMHRFFSFSVSSCSMPES